MPNQKETALKKRVIGSLVGLLVVVLTSIFISGEYESKGERALLVDNWAILDVAKTSSEDESTISETHTDANESSNTAEDLDIAEDFAKGRAYIGDLPRASEDLNEDLDLVSDGDELNRAGEDLIDESIEDPIDVTSEDQSFDPSTDNDDSLVEETVLVTPTPAETGETTAIPTPTAAPTRNSTTKATTALPTTSTVAPTTAKPTVAPTTAKATVVPTTAKPTVAPTTTKPTPTPVPTTVATTAAPTTVAPTTTQAPTTTAAPTTVAAPPPSNRYYAPVKAKNGQEPSNTTVIGYLAGYQIETYGNPTQADINHWMASFKAVPEWIKPAQTIRVVIVEGNAGHLYYGGGTWGNILGFTHVDSAAIYVSGNTRHQTTAVHETAHVYDFYSGYHSYSAGFASVFEAEKNQLPHNLKQNFNVFEFFAEGVAQYVFNNGAVKSSTPKLYAYINGLR